MPSLCSTCRGHGVTPRISRIVSHVSGEAEPLTLLVRCGDCEGHGVELTGEDRDFLREDFPEPSAPVNQRRKQVTLASRHPSLRG